MQIRTSPTIPYLVAAIWTLAAIFLTVFFSKPQFLGWKFVLIIDAITFIMIVFMIVIFKGENIVVENDRIEHRTYNHINRSIPIQEIQRFYKKDRRGRGTGNRYYVPIYCVVSKNRRFEFSRGLYKKEEVRQILDMCLEINPTIEHNFDTFKS